MRGSRLVLDTNIWVSYFIKDRFVELVLLIDDNDLTVCTSVFLIAELTEVLGRKKFSKYLTQSVTEYIDFHKKLTTLVEVHPVFLGSPDPKDDFLFDLAQQSGSVAVVTGDGLLQVAKEIGGIPVISLTALKVALQNIKKPT
jgi:uncharacterized protein